MGSSDRSSPSSLTLSWAMLVLSIGALLGVGVATLLLNRRDRAQADDPDAPLFI